MPTLLDGLREVIADWALGPEKQKLQDSVQILFESQRYAITPESLIQQLGEVDSHLIDVFLRSRGYETVIGQGLGRRSQVTEQQRLAAVDDARYMNQNDVMISRSVKVLTDFGFGQRVQITPRDKDLAQRWENFWSAPANDYVLNEREIGQLSTDQITDGEFFFVFFISTLDGTCTVRQLSTDRIIRIETERDDPKVPVYYVENTLQGEIWYPDWRASQAQLERIPVKEGARKIDDIRENTTAVALHVAFEKVNGRGWPMIHRALVWARAYRDFLQDRATVARAVATYVDKLTAKGGSRVGTALMGQLASSLSVSTNRGERNPAPAAGSTWFQNEALDRERMPLATGAGDAQTDGMTIAAQVSSGTGSPLHFLNRPDAMQNRAVARESGQPFIKQIQRYQTFWTSIYQDMVRIVASAWEQYDRLHPQIADHSADILLDSPFEADITELAAIMGAVTTAAGSSQLDQDVAQRINAKLAELALTALGVRDPANILNPADGVATRGNDTSPDAVKTATENWLAGRTSDRAFAEFMRGVLDDAAL